MSIVHLSACKDDIGPRLIEFFIERSCSSDEDGEQGALPPPFGVVRVGDALDEASLRHALVSVAESHGQRRQVATNSASRRSRSVRHASAGTRTCAFLVRDERPKHCRRPSPSPRCSLVATQEVLRTNHARPRPCSCTGLPMSPNRQILCQNAQRKRIGQKVYGQNQTMLPG